MVTSLVFHRSIDITTIFNSILCFINSLFLFKVCRHRSEDLLLISFIGRRVINLRLDKTAPSREITLKVIEVRIFRSKSSFLVLFFHIFIIHASLKNILSRLFYPVVALWYVPQLLLTSRNPRLCWLCLWIECDQFDINLVWKTCLKSKTSL